jgi:hypothetical protein
MYLVSPEDGFEDLSNTQCSTQGSSGVREQAYDSLRGLYQA